MQIGVYGLGRFGSFWAGALSERFHVKGYNRTPGRIIPDSVELVTEDELLFSDVIFLCTAISSIEQVLGEIAGRVRPDALVIDTCSVKMFPVQCMKTLLPGTVSIIGSHPMFGPDSARGGLTGLPVILSRVRSSPEQFEFWKQAFLSMGLKVIELSPEDHDREAAYTQGITHFIGRVLSDLELKPSEIATLGYQRLLQVMEQTCNDPWQLFVDLQHYNPFTGEMRFDLKKSLHHMMDKLEASLDSKVTPGYDSKKNEV